MLVWIGLGLVLALGLARLFAGYPRSAFPHLARREAAFVEAAALTMFPPGGEIPESGVDAGIPAYIDGYVEAVPARQGLLIRALFLLVEQATLFFPAPGARGWRRFSSLSPEQREEALEGWRTSGLFPRRVVFLALRSLLTMGYFACPAVLRRVDLAPMDIPPPVVEADLLFPRVGEPRDRIPHGPEDLTRVFPEPQGPDAPVHPDYREPAG